jgi:hypothetical protein
VDACLQLRYLATDFLQLSAPAQRGPHRTRSFPFIVACIRVYKTVAWKRVDKIRYSIFMTGEIMANRKYDSNKRLPFLLYEYVLI